MGNSKLQDQVAVVTGSSRGIGEAIALALADEGATVTCVARSTQKLERLVERIERKGGSALAVRCDITDGDDVRELQRVVRSTFDRVDILVNNAGVYRANRFLDYDIDEFRDVLEVNLLGTVRATQAFLPQMLERGSGRVVNIASTAGKYGSLFQSAYNASKHAVVGLTRCLALETAQRGVRVNAVCPGFVDTDMVADDIVGPFADILGLPPDEVIPTVLQRVPIGRMVTPSEVAELVVYLSSPAADAMTGQALTISGGMVLV